MEYPKVCLRRGEEAGVLKGQRLIYRRTRLGGRYLHGRLCR